MQESASTIENLVPPGLKPTDKLGGWWFRLAVILLLLLGLAGQWMLKQWISSTYVSQANNAAAWDKQVDINTRLSEQLSTLTQSDSVASEVDKRQDIRLDSLERDIREQRHILSR